MKYILTAGWEDGMADLTQRLVRELAGGKRILWLVSGGSNVQASVKIMDNISAKLSRKLSVSLVDERYGPPGHDQSNWERLMAAGFDGKEATLLPVLKPDRSFKQAIKDYAQLIEEALAACDMAIAQLGIGPDGHLAGILPGSPAAEETEALVSGYEAPPLKRLTLTFPALRRLNAAYAFAFGPPKLATLTKLQAGKADMTDQPAQILKDIPEAYVYSDQVGDHA